jgi:hypothetical protein
MDTQQLLSTARSSSVPDTWFVWTLRREHVLRGAAKWTAAGVIFLFLLIVVFQATFPENFQLGGFSFVATSLLLLVLAGVAFGGLGIAVYDAWRVAHASEYLLVITPDDYVKAEPQKTTHIPMSAIRHVTLKGLKLPQEQAAAMPDPRVQRAGYQSGRGGFLPAWTGGNIRRQPAQAPSLAFEDIRSGKIVIVAMDDSFETLPALAEVLRMYAFENERTQAG